MGQVSMSEDIAERISEVGIIRRLPIEPTDLRDLPNTRPQLPGVNPEKAFSLLERAIRRKD